MQEQRSVKVLAIAYLVGALLALTATAAGADPWGNWHGVTLPNGNHDQVRVHHGERGTLCDFKRANRFDSRLVAIDVSWRACVPSGEEHGD